MNMLLGVGRWLPVLITDNQNQPVTGIAYDNSGLEVLFQKHGGIATTKHLTANDWRESAKGGYLVLADADDADTLGEFIYYVDFTNAVVYPGVVDVVNASDGTDILALALTGYEASTLAGVLVAILDKVAGGTITTIAPVLADGTVVSLIKGDDYSNTDGKALIWSEKEAGVWPDLANAVIKFIIPLPDGTTFEVEGVASLSGGLANVMFELDHADTEAIGMEGNGLFWVKATMPGVDARVNTLAHGKVRVSTLTSWFN